MTPVDVERVRLALEQVLQTSVQVLTQEQWATANRRSGEPTRLSAPFGPYLGIQGNSDFQFAVASAAPFADEPGFHHVRRDERDAPDVINVDSYIPILDLPAADQWSEVVRVAGLVDTSALTAAVRLYVFAYRRNRDDHHSPTVPEDIAQARPLGEGGRS